MIGDRLYTDVAMGNAAGIPAVLVLSGETQPADLANSPYHPDYVFNHLGEAAGWLRACAEAGSPPSAVPDPPR
jgi:ribonucleotide monophosphatase NagD (HAD superfamily)